MSDAPAATEAEIELRAKLEQARIVINRLVDGGEPFGAEGHRARAYFSSSRFDPDFLPWPRPGIEGIRPENLSAANDD